MERRQSLLGSRVVMLFFGDAYRDKKILVTGHTGFKGSWLCFWLAKLGAQVCGYSLPAPTEPSHYSLKNFPHENISGDIRDVTLLEKTVCEFSPDMVFHLAAQALVRPSYENARETFDVNVMGTTHVLEACRRQSSVRAVIVVTSDKCYQNKETSHLYQETDPLGGHDPYSASKGCAELVAASYRQSFFQEKGNNILLATTRAGNVLGGGDWAVDRLMPDLVRSALSGKPVKIRYPQAVRPWQHVLDALSGYLLLGQKLLEGNGDCAEAWNFGPDTVKFQKVQDLIEKARKLWPKISVTEEGTTSEPYEAALLALDITKARQKLLWEPVWDTDTVIRRTVNWYKAFYENESTLTGHDLEAYTRDALQRGAVWAK